MTWELSVTVMLIGEGRAGVGSGSGPGVSIYIIHIKAKENVHMWLYSKLISMNNIKILSYFLRINCKPESHQQPCQSNARAGPCLVRSVILSNNSNHNGACIHRTPPLVWEMNWVFSFCFCNNNIQSWAEGCKGFANLPLMPDHLFPGLKI